MTIREDYISAKKANNLTDKDCDEAALKCGFAEVARENLELFKSNVGKWKGVFGDLVQSYPDNTYVKNADYVLSAVPVSPNEMQLRSALRAVSSADDAIVLGKIGGRRKRVRKTKRRFNRRRTVRRRRA